MKYCLDNYLEMNNLLGNEVIFIENKICNRCKEEKQISDFYKQEKKKPNGEIYTYVRPDCISCVKEKARVWAENNPEIIKEAKRKYNKSEKGRPKLAANSKRQKENGDYYKWVDDNRSYVNEYNRNRRMNKEHEITSSEWEACKEYFDNSCAYCGINENSAKEKQGTFLHKEHVDHEGSNDLSNCIPSCRKCNSSKWARNLNDFYNISNPNYSEERNIKINKWLTDDYKIHKE